MSIKLIYQSAGPHCCGQCCVAMAAGVDLRRALGIVNKAYSLN